MNKNECDHLIGVAGYVSEWCFDGDKILMSDVFNIKNTRKWISSLEDILERFYFCPKKGCGHPIYWETLEKINPKKDE